MDEEDIIGVASNCAKPSAGVINCKGIISIALPSCGGLEVSGVASQPCKSPERGKPPLPVRIVIIRIGRSFTASGIRLAVLGSAIIVLGAVQAIQARSAVPAAVDICLIAVSNGVIAGIDADVVNENAHLAGGPAAAIIKPAHDKIKLAFGRGGDAGIVVGAVRKAGGRRLECSNQRGVELPVPDAYGLFPDVDAHQVVLPDHLGGVVDCRKVVVEV